MLTQGRTFQTSGAWEVAKLHTETTALRLATRALWALPTCPCLSWPLMPTISVSELHLKQHPLLKPQTTMGLPGS